jgi:ubiquinone/menaquinone biosynthesis C-methylase UbiE
MKARIVSALRRLRRRVPEPTRFASVSEYWNHHNVTHHRAFTTAEESLQNFQWRNGQYANYLALMPVSGYDGCRVLDYGCGPGHDLVGFGVYSKPAKLAGADVSASSIREARARLALHGIDAEVHRIEPGGRLPFDDAAFDHVHSSGVLHHVDDPIATLRELKRVLRRGGSLNVMVYNFDSVWTHLFVAYHRAILAGRYAGLPLREQFARSTDGEACPISRCYQPDEFLALARTAGFDATFAGAAVSMHELSLLPTRYEAIMDPRLPDESRRFLESLEFDRHLLPLNGGRHAGVDGIYHLRN